MTAENLLSPGQHPGIEVSVETGLAQREQVAAQPGNQAQSTALANAYAERFVRTVRADCLDCLLILGRRHLEHVLAIYLDHYNRARPHRALALQPPDGPGTTTPPRAGSVVVRRDRLGGLLHEHERAAA